MSTAVLLRNALNPTTPSVKQLRKPRWKMGEVNKNRLRRIDNKKSSKFQNNINNQTHSETLGLYGDLPNDVDANNRNEQHGTVSSNHLTHSMLVSSLSNGEVRIPGPLDHPRRIRSSSLRPSCSTRRERVRRRFSTNLPIEANLFADIQVVSFLEAQFQEPSRRAQSMNQLRKKYSSQNKIKTSAGGIKLRNSSSSQKATVKKREASSPTYPSTRRKSLPCLDMLCVKPNINYSSSCKQQNPFHKTVTKDKKPLLLDARRMTICGDLPTPDNTNSNLESGDIAGVYGVAKDKNNTLQVKAELEVRNLRPVENDECSLPASSFAGKEDSSSIKGEENEDVADSHNADESVDPNATDTRSGSRDESNSSITGEETFLSFNKKSFDKHKVFLQIWHHLFGIHWIRKNRKKDDKKPLIEEEFVGEDDSSQPDRTMKKKMKKKKKQKTKKWRWRQSLVDKKTSLDTRCRPSKAKPAEVDNQSPVTRKKRRRLRKKNVYRAGRQLRKNLGHGCRNIGHGFSYLISELPDAPAQKGANGYNRHLDVEDQQASSTTDAGSRRKRFITVDFF